MAVDVALGHRFADHRGHAGLPEHRVGPTGDARLATEDGCELAAHRVGDREPGLGPEAARLVVAAPAAGRVTGAEGEEEVGGVAVRLRGQDRIVGAGGVERGAGADLVELADHRPGQRLEPGRGGDEHAAAGEAVGTAAEHLTLAHAGHRPLGQGPDPIEHGDRRRATDAVGGEVHVALELDQRARWCRRRGCRPRGRRRSRGRSAGAATRRRRRRAASDGAGRGVGRRGAQPLSTTAAQVWGPQTPSTRRPRLSWNARTTRSVAAPNDPASTRGISWPSVPSRTWRSRTASPRLPGRSTAGSLKR